MHSRIFQVSSKPISKEEYLNEEDVFNDTLMDYCAAYCDRKDAIEWLTSTFPEGTFACDGIALTLLDLQPLLDMWQRNIEENFWGLKEKGVRDAMARYKLNTSINIPLGDFLFSIDEWSGPYAVRSDVFVDWLLSKVKRGDKIYFGAVFDYHS